MPIKVFSGLPGSGKSSSLIELVNNNIGNGQPTLTFACSDSPRLKARTHVWKHRVLGCRRPGLTCPLHHFVSPSECASILEQTAPETLVAFDEAFDFGPEIVPHWIDASRRGLDVLLVTPSKQQIRLLGDYDYMETTFELTCQECSSAVATNYFVVPDRDATLSVCENCAERLTNAARAEILDRLQRQAPYPGEKALYQPVELEECASWRVLRPDSAARVETMAHALQEVGLPGVQPSGHATYLDVGCNTGFFCHHMRKLGFFAEGVDLVEGDIAVARRLDSFFRKDFNKYMVANAYDYLRDTQDQKIDVTSAFAVFQWVMIQTSLERGLDCMRWLFAKTNHVCFLEMGYSAEPQYKDKFGIEIDRSWVHEFMQREGGFSDVRVVDGKQFGSTFGRDLFIGVKS